MSQKGKREAQNVIYHQKERKVRKYNQEVSHRLKEPSRMSEKKFFIGHPREIPREIPS